jgi:hypothetical protein
MDTMQAIARAAIDSMPPASRFTEADSDVIRAHTDYLLTLESDLVATFYDSLYAHPPTAAVFVEGERSARETTLTQWWRRTVHGPHDDTYFAWMAMVGLVHVARGVTNSMMLAMTDITVSVVTRAVDDDQRADLGGLPDAFRRLAATVGAIISYGYDQAVAAALFNIAGMPEALLRRLLDQEVREALPIARAELRTPAQVAGAEGAGTEGAGA